MYSVFRFVAGPGCTDEALTSVGASLNAVFPGVFKRFDYAGRRFSGTLSSSDTWNDHLEAALKFLRKATQVIAVARTQDVMVVIDVAVEPEDCGKAAILSCDIPPDALFEFGRLGVGFAISVYSPGASE